MTAEPPSEEVFRDSSVPKWLAIVNPVAGGGGCRRRFRDPLACLRDAGLDIEVRESRYPGHTTELARRAYAEGRRGFLAVGGDGTTWELINGLLPEALDAASTPLLGIVPLGTGNSFVRDYTEGRALEYALEAIRAGRRRRCDLIRAAHTKGETFFLNLLSLGFVAEVCSLANARFKWLGHRGYALAVFLRLLRLRARNFPHCVDGGPVEREPVTMLSFSNSRYTGGNMLMAPSADPADGAGDLIRLEPVSRLGLLRAFPRIFNGTHVALPTVSERRFKEITFQLDRAVTVMIDGEVLDLQLERLEVLPGAIEVCL